MADNLLIVQDERLVGAELTRHYRYRGWEVMLADTWSSAVIS